VVGHRDLFKTHCPGFNVKEWQARRKGLPEAERSKRSDPGSYKPLVYSVLREGAKGPLVKNLQARLNRFFTIDVDGLFGPQTTQAVKAFQSRHNLIADGVVGPKTWTALLRYD
jgi:peptidoglycan hydrolase-like protein with peptidoglycan-binding domain